MSHVAAGRSSRAAAFASRPPTATIGDWELVELVHRGRWCSLWRARPLAVRETRAGEYAIKVAHDDSTHGQWGRQMLRRETIVSHAVVQPHLITVLSSHTAHTPAYIVLPLIEGATLGATLAEFSFLPLGHALWLARQVAEALAALHERGWLHGDVKPENVMVQPDGHATLIDLGFAQPLGQAAAANARMFCGTLRYTAPERFVSTTATCGASDCYSLGVMLFEMFAGRAPFAISDAHALVIAHVEQSPPDVRELTPQIPREVSHLLQELLSKDPLRRPTAAELVRRLCRLEIENLQVGRALMPVRYDAQN